MISKHLVSVTMCHVSNVDLFPFQCETTPFRFNSLISSVSVHVSISFSYWSTTNHIQSFEVHLHCVALRSTLLSTIVSSLLLMCSFDSNNNNRFEYFF